MALAQQLRHLRESAMWHIRGLGATENLRRVGFAARSLCQPTEIKRRRDAAACLAQRFPDAERVPIEAGYLRLPALKGVDFANVAALGSELADAAMQRASNDPGGKRFHHSRLVRARDMPPILKAALQPRMLAIASAYLGTVPILGDVDYFVSLPSEPPWSQSQLWHCDDDAPRQLKLFVYCDDVGEADGPFELIEAAESAKIRKAVGYRYAGRRYRVSDITMDAVLTPRKRVSIRASAGSAFVVDTARCFHRGSRITERGRRRVVGVALYCTPNGSKLPLRLASRRGPVASRMGEGVLRKLSPLQRAVLGDPISRELSEP